MQNTFSQSPPIPILVLSILVLLWILPVLFTRIARSLRPRSGRFSDDPRKVSAVRRSFYWTLIFTTAWSLLSLAAYHKRSELDDGMIAIIGLGLIATILRYFQWRCIRAMVGSDEQPAINSELGK
jgi:hypothetical protein